MKRLIWALQFGFGGIWLLALLWLSQGFLHERQWNLSALPVKQIADLRIKLMERSLATNDLELAGNWHRQRAEELVRPETVLPQISEDPTLKQLLTWGASCKGQGVPALTPALRKLKSWLESQCYKKSLSAQFFTTEPYLHPLGGSWLAWAYHQDAKTFDLQWLVKHKEFLHLLELPLLPSEALDGRERVLGNLKPGELDQLLRGASLIYGQHHTLLLRSAYHNSIAYQVIETPFLESYLANSPFSIESTSLTSTCHWREGEYCWQLNHPWPWSRRLNIFYFITMLALAGAVVWIWLRKLQERQIFERDREILVQTLAHELRHPATSLGLSLEVLRQKFDALPDLAQSEFLRMCDQLTRLKRLIRASDQYLQAKSQPGEPFQFNWVRLESINEYLQEILNPYLEKIEFSPLPVDETAVVDPYWLSLCVTNLVKNALIHGVKPIQVKVETSSEVLTIVVQDQGQKVALSFAEMISARRKREGSPGMGLGLSLVHRLAHLMQGRLEFSTQPSTTFKLVLKRQHAQNLAS